MPEYRRWMVPGATWFFTVVTASRQPLFENDAAVRLLGAVMRDVRAEAPYWTIASVVLPDHLHCIWVLPQSDSDFSTRWKRIKQEFSCRWLRSGGHEVSVSDSRRSKGERGVWQRRFWEHLVRDEEDLEHCCDYIHYNPVKHGYVLRPVDWPWSSLSRFVRMRHYPVDWGSSLPTALVGDSREFGE
jgi:putative transposase